MSLTPEQLEQWETEGSVLCINILNSVSFTLADDRYLVLPDFLTPDEVQKMLTRTHELLEEFDPAAHPLTAFKTGRKDGEHVGDNYFLTSGDKVLYQSQSLRGSIAHARSATSSSRRRSTTQTRQDCFTLPRARSTRSDMVCLPIQFSARSRRPRK